MITNIGFILLAIWLILYGIFALIPGLTSPPLNYVLAILGIVTGILILTGR